MLDSLYTGMSGLLGYSKDLSVVGNNVSNVNTPGYKASQTLFSDLYYRVQYGDGSDGQGGRFELGSGVAADQTRRLFAQGELRQSGNALDAGVDGNGFFVVRRDDRLFYTRAGQFSFGDDGLLVARAGSGRVQALVGGALQDVSLAGRRTNAGKATTEASLTGVLSNTQAVSSPVDITNVVVYDSAGLSHTLTVRMTNNTSVTTGSWLVEVLEGTTTIRSGGEVRFSADGTPAPAFNSIDVTLSPAGLAASTFKLSMGEVGSTAGVRSIAATSNDVNLDRQDGYGVGSLTRTTLDDKGVLQFAYSNGQTVKGEQVALADFEDTQALLAVEGNLFQPGTGQRPRYGTAGADGFGVLSPGRVELSNVELSQEFGNLIISQRGYQASSQVISTANEMLQQLLDLKARR